MPENDPPALTAALRQLFSNPETRRQLAQSGRQRALANYTWDQVARQRLEMYHEALNLSPLTV